MAIKTYPLKLEENVNFEVKVMAAKERVSMQEWIATAVKEKIERDDEYLLELLDQAYMFIKGGPVPHLEQAIKEYCETLSKR